MVQKTILAGIFSLALMFFFTGQSGAQETEIFAPFVLELEGELRNNLIRLSWKDSQDIRGPVYIYRSEVPFSTLAVLPAPVEVVYGTGSYLDEAERPGIVYYFVVASDEWGWKYTLPIPYTNMINIAISPDNVPGVPVHAPLRPAGPSQAGRAGSMDDAFVIPAIEGINAQTEEDKVIISFSGADDTRNLLLYRSLSPIRRQEDLLSALIIRQNVGSPIVDYPLPGISYFYALVYEDDLNAGIFSIRPGYNATGAVQLFSSNIGLRNMPLPGIGTGTPSSEPAALGSEAEEAVSLMIRAAGRNEKIPRPEMTILPQDMVKGGSGEDAQLRSIVQGYFSLQEWDKARDEFIRFLDLPRTGYNQRKVRFYLGQIYYFLGKPREALMEFLQAREEFPEKTNPWIQAVLGEFSRN